MFRFGNEGSAIYHRGIFIVKLVIVLSIVLTQISDDTYFEPLFRGLWLLSASTWGVLEGVKLVIAKQNRIGYLYFIGVSVFLISIIYMSAIMN